MLGKLQVFRNQPEVDLENDPEWTRDPIKSKTWRLYYHGLTWLLAPAWGALHGLRRRRARELVETYLASYLRANIFQRPADSMAWDDHATADRLAIICWLVDRLPALRFALGQGCIETAVGKHVEKLIEFYQSGKWLQSNHGLFHALALLDVPLVFPDHPYAKRAESVGRVYLSCVVRKLVDPYEAISTEQSLHYHQFVIRVLRSMRPFLNWNYPELSPVVDRALEGMVHFNWCIAGANASMPAIGDTRAFDRIPRDTLVQDAERKRARASSRLRGRWSVDLAPPEDNLPGLVVYPRTGYAIFRCGSRFDRTASRATLVAHPARVGHGHFDALSVTLQLRGVDVLIDSGGPFAYGDRLRFAYFVASRAHNVVLVNDEDHKAPGQLTFYGSHDGIHWATAQHRGYPGRLVIRSTIWFPGHTLLIFDQVTRSARATFDCLWHFPPETVLTTSKEGARVKTAIRIGTQSFYSGAMATSPLEAEVVEGVLHPKPQGWITARLQMKQPAPVQILQSTGSELLMATYFSTSDQPELIRTSDAVLASVDGITVAVDGLGLPQFSSRQRDA